MSNLVALLIVTNLVCKPCPYCNVRPEGMNLPPGVGISYPVVHEHQYEAVVTTNYLPVAWVPDQQPPAPVFVPITMPAPKGGAK